MAIPSDDPGLPETLEQVLDRVPAGEDRERLRSLFEAASRAIGALGELDLSAHESEDLGTADLSVWEELAPIIGGTFTEVNALLTTVRERMPEPAAQPEVDVDAAFDAFFGDDPEASELPRPAQAGSPGAAPAASGGVPAGSPEAEEAGRRDEACRSVRAIATSLEREVAAFGASLRQPQVMADRWNLLDHLQSFRGKCRAGIGEMVFVAAGAYAEVRKEAVVPGFRAEIARGLALRRALVALRGAVAARNARIRRGEPVRPHAAKVLEAVGKLTGGKAWALLRAADKRAFIAARGDLQCVVGDAQAPDRAVAQAVEGLARFLDSLSVINRRESLVLHDRAALTRGARLAGAAASVSGRDPGAAAQRLDRALTLARTLLGRDPDLDVWLRRARELVATSLGPDELRETARDLEARLGAVPKP